MTAEAAYRDWGPSLRCRLTATPDTEQCILFTCVFEHPREVAKAITELEIRLSRLSERLRESGKLVSRPPGVLFLIFFP